MASKEKGSRAHSVMGGGKKKSSGGKPHEIHVRPAHGGYIAKHIKHAVDGQMPEETEHTMPDMAALQQHMADNMPPPSSPAPAPQGEPGMGAPPMPQPGM